MFKKIEKQSSNQNFKDTFSLLVDAVEDYAIFALDKNGLIMSWNLGGLRLKGYSAEEVIGTHFSRFYTEEDITRNHPQNELKIATEKGKYEEEGWRIKKDGTKFWANIVITALRDSKGVLQGFGKVTRDLTEKKLAEEKLKESEERFRLLIEGVQDYAIFMLDPQGNVATWNKGAERNKGYKADEIIGKHFSNFYMQVDKDSKKPERELEGAIKSGRFEDEGWRVRKDGTKFWANVVITPMYDKKNKLLGFSKVTRDLTERKVAEDDLKKSYAELEIRVEKRTKELSEEKLKAEQAVRARDEFFSIASHELKTPLSSLKLQAQIRKRSVLKGDFSDFAPDRLVELCNDDNRQVERLTFLVDNMLDVSRLTSGNVELYREEVDLVEFLNDVVKRMSPILNESGNTISLTSVSKVIGNWDRHRLEQVVVNLLTNCGKYAPSKPVEISTVVDSTSVKILIKDYGPGISKDIQKKIFEPFHRGVSNSEVSGLGLGLYIVKKIIDAHAGKITVESEIGKGSTFIIELPISLQEQGA